MKDKRITILHFNILECYPPVLNLISDVLAQQQNFQISVFTSQNISPFKQQKFSGIKIWRLGSVSKNSFKRYLSYFTYNLISSLALLIKRPDVVLVYESLSIFPAYVYSLIFKRAKIHVHYHEYVSLPEMRSSSKYMQFLYFFERKLHRKVTISQTNEDRKSLFLTDHPNLRSSQVYVFPNLPPTNWWQNYGQQKKTWNGGKIKLVYVGVLDGETMYLEQLLDWVFENASELDLTIYSQSISESGRLLINKYPGLNLSIKDAVSYYELPLELTKFDIGLVLYKGHIPNYIYNIPNKVFEYLSCGLKVFGSNNIKSMQVLNSKNVILFDMNNFFSLSIEDLKILISKQNGAYLAKNKTIITQLF